MASFHHYVPTALDNEPETPPNQSGSSQRWVRDPNIDPALYTPSKRMRFMTHALSTTTSGSFLISNEPITSSHPIPEPVLEGPPMLAAPNWDLAWYPLQNVQEKTLELHGNTLAPETA
ncbi:hypothetical protein C8J56DRAFT_1065754 [Mycena floridula]|nr:hypothetical protein C8J56DRAFT_1065754 [Mycena floridula]